jgi:hypothetical protein
MKRTVIIALLAFSANCIYAQSLIEIYKKGTVKLIPDTEYAQGNDWGKILPINPENLYDDPKGDEKSLVVMPDGSVAVNHYVRNYFSVYDPAGKYINDYYVTSSTGRKFLSHITIKGVYNNFFFNRPEAMGNMNCFDFEGKYIKTLTFKHSIKGIIPLSENKFVVTGWSMWKTKFRDFVAIIDFDTDMETIIWDHFTERSDIKEQRALYDYSYNFENGGSVGFTSMPYTKMLGIECPIQIALVKGKIIIAVPSTGEILIYSIDSKLISKEKINWGSNEISVNEQKEIQKNAIERVRNGFKGYEKAGFPQKDIDNAKKALIAQMEEDMNRITTPIKKPFFSSIIKDSDDNLLFFEIPEVTGANKFNVWIYNDGGNFIGKCSFECDEYELSITPSKMVFHNGYIYSLQTLKNATENPLRLVRFKLSGNSN